MHRIGDPWLASGKVILYIGNSLENVVNGEYMGPRFPLRSD
jgi:hypothetical protein